MPRDDFNYKVALAQGSRNLEAGQLRKAEQQFRYAMKRCPECGGGYRGLAKVFVELDDPPSALSILREGAQALARANNRNEAIDLLRDAVHLAPQDLGLHRRYAAALANAGDEAGAIAEYERYIGLVLSQGDTGRARTELDYALATLGRLRGLVPIAERIVREERSGSGISTPPSHASRPGSTEPRPADRSGSPSPTVEPADASSQRTAQSAPAREKRSDGGRAASPAFAGSRVSARAGEREWEGIAVPSQSVDVGELVHTQPDPRERALALEADAQGLLARRDPRAAHVALEAARALLGEGLQLAAADILLQVVALGIPDRDAQRLLVDVARALGRHELARDKCALLAEALRLDGRPDAAAEIERLAAG